MVEPQRYAFRPVTRDDLALIKAWRATPHVRAWWDAWAGDAAEAVADPKVTRWIVSLGARPIGFMQDYSVHGWDQHHFAHLPEGSRGIDQYLGAADMLGQGHGTGFIRQRVQALFADGVPVVATDPHPDNARAIAVYEKVGFRVAGPVEETPWGRILPMVARCSV